jgi:hypothetical protein
MSEPASYLLADLIGGSEAADKIASLAERVRRLTPSHRDPERFYLDRSEIAAELRRIAREMEGITSCSTT